MITNTIEIIVNDFQLCDIIHRRRLGHPIKLNSDNCSMLVNCQTDGKPILKDGKVCPIPYTYIKCTSKHITLTNHFCILKVDSIQSQEYNKILYFKFGDIIFKSIEADYTIN